MNRTFCVECGPNVKVDEDGCCVTCGGNAMGRWAERAVGAIEKCADYRRRIRLASRQLNQFNEPEVGSNSDLADAFKTLDLRRPLPKGKR